MYLRLPVASMGLMLCAGCSPITLNIPPPPAVPAAIAAPGEPTIHSEASDFEPAASQEGVGSSRLRLKPQQIGLGPIADSSFVTDLHDHLLVALLAGGFKKVVDLQASTDIAASHTKKSSAEAVELSGAMNDVMEVVPVSRARILVTGEIVHHDQEERRLPVRFWYSEDELAVYQETVDDYGEARGTRLSSLDKIEAEYAQTYRTKKSEYDASLPWWQKLQNTVVKPEAVKAYEAFVEELDEVRRAMPGGTPTAGELSQAADSRKETQTVSIYVARLRLHVRSPNTGEVLTVLHAAAEGRTAEELVDNLVGIVKR